MPPVAARQAGDTIVQPRPRWPRRRGRHAPLEGIRVLDFTTVWAGPYGGGLLARLGAEVILVETPFKKAELLSSADADRSHSHWGLRDFETYSFFCDLEKKSIMVNLKDPRGAGLVRELAAVSDVVIENYGGPGVMQKFGLGYEDLAGVNPRIIYCGMPAMGMTGPEKDYVAFGVSIEQLAGFVALQGYEDSDTPQKSGINYGDPIAGMTACGAIVTALIQRERTGRGQLVDLSQREAAASVIADSVMDYVMNARPPRRYGNHHPWMAPHNVYRAAGDDAWAVIACRDDGDWRRLTEAIGHPELGDDARFATVLARKHNEAELDSLIGEWVAARTPLEVQSVLQAAGVPAGRVAPVEEVPDDPHVRARGMWQSMHYPHNGRTYPLQMAPWIFARAALPDLHRAPYKGQNTAYVLDLIGRRDELEPLVEAGVLGRPEGEANSP